jgi:hypothetical protein
MRTPLNHGPRTFDAGVIDRASQRGIDRALGAALAANPGASTVLPTTAQQRLDALRNESLDLAAATQRVVDEQAETLRDREIARQRLRSVTQNRRADAQHVTDAQQVVDGLSDKITRSQARIRELTARVAPLRRTVARCDRWLVAETRRGFTEAEMPEVKLPKNATHATYVETLRERLRTLGAEANRIRSQPVSSKAAKDALRAAFAAAVARTHDIALRAVETKRVVIPEIQVLAPINAYAIDEGATRVHGNADVRVPDLTSLILASPIGEQVLAWWEGEVDRLSDDANALDPATRADLLATNAAATLLCERQEAEVIFVAAEQGLTIAHRPDIDPRALLGLEGLALRE